MITDKLTQAVAEAYKKMKQEELKGDQHKIDANKNGEIDAHDFHLLRKQKTEKNESWDSKKSAVSEQRLEEGKQKLSNRKLLELIAKCRSHARQLDAAGSRGEYSLSSGLLEQAADAIEGMMQHKKITEAKNELAVAPGAPGAGAGY